MRFFRSLVQSLLACFVLSGCATSNIVQDPTDGLPVEKILKSIRCEMVTFIEINRTKRQEYGLRYKGGSETAYSFPYLDLADNLFAGVFVDLKDVDVVNLTVGGTRNVPLTATKSINWIFGPSLNQQNTFELIQNFAMLQNAKLSDPIAIPSELRRRHGPLNEEFRCYKSLQDTTIEDLSLGQRPELEMFDRIYVNGKLPLSQWLYNVASTMSKNFLAGIENLDYLAPGQLSYNFIFDYKAALNGKYSLIASLWKPFEIGGTISRENSSSFTLIFNTNYAVATAGAKNGTSGIFVENPNATLLGANGPLNSNHGARYPRRSNVQPDRSREFLVQPKAGSGVTPFDLKNNPPIGLKAPLALPPTINVQ